MATDIYDWSTTAADNDDADTSINWLEGQAPSSVNNSARGVMKRVAELLDDLGAVGAVGGTANAITLTSAIGSLGTAKFVRFKCATRNTGAVTIDVNSLGAKAIRKMVDGSDAALASGDLIAGNRYLLLYDAAANTAAGAWIVLNPSALILGPGSASVPAIRFVGSAGSASDQDTGVFFHEVSTELGVGLAAGGVEVIAAVKDGVSSAVAKVYVQLDIAGAGAGQIVFPGTQNPSSGANTLDDYEEGTTTPTVTATVGTFTTVSATLAYTKIGNRVAWNATITITDNGTAATAVILPMPFTCGSQAAGCAGIRTDNGTAVNGRIAASGTTAVLFLYNGTYPGATGGTITVGGTFSV